MVNDVAPTFVAAARVRTSAIAKDLKADCHTAPHPSKITTTEAKEQVGTRDTL